MTTQPAGHTTQTSPGVKRFRTLLVLSSFLLVAGYGSVQTAHAESMPINKNVQINSNTINIQSGSGSAQDLNVSVNNGEVSIKTQDGEKVINVGDGANKVNIEVKDGNFSLKAEGNGEKVELSGTLEELLSKTFQELNIKVSPDGTSAAKLRTTKKNGEDIYEVSGTSAQKFLGFIPVDIPMIAEVSASNGDVKVKADNFFYTIFDFLSF